MEACVTQVEAGDTFLFRYKQETWGWNWFALAVRFLQLNGQYPQFSLLFNHSVQARD